MISTLNIKKHLKYLIFILLIVALPIKADTNHKNQVNIYFFYSNDCSHCHQEEKYLKIIEKKYSNVNIYHYEIHDEQNNEIRTKVQELYNIKTNGVPLTIIGDTYYIGYSDKKSNLIYTKTIEYYSKYNYKDQVGELLQIKDMPAYKEEDNIPTLKEFINTYGNYKLIGSLYTDKLDLSSNALILGILSQFNLIKILFIIIVLLVISKTKDQKQELYLLIGYLTISILLNANYITSNYIYNLIFTLVLISLFTFAIIKSIKNKKYLYIIMLIVTSITSSYLENHFYSTYAKIFKEIIYIHNEPVLNTISSYGNYFFIITIINTLFIMVLYSLKNKIINKQKRVSL